MNKKMVMAVGMGAIILGGAGMMYEHYQGAAAVTNSKVAQVEENDQVQAKEEEITSNNEVDDPTGTRSLDEMMQKDEVERDLKVMMTAFKMYHPGWGDDKDVAMTTRVEKLYDSEVAKLPDQMTVLQAWQVYSRIIHEMGDAHTRVSVVRNNGEKRYAVNGKILAINGEPIEAISERFLALWPYDTLSYGMTRFEKYIVYEDYMHLAGIDVTGGVDITYLVDGKEVTKHFEAYVFKDTSSEFVSYQADKAHHLGLFKLDTFKYNNETYLKALQVFFKAVKEQQIDNVVLDLRENNGGALTAIKDFMRYIDVDQYQWCNNFQTRTGSVWQNELETVTNDKADEAFGGKIYVLTSPKTFSAAMDLAMIIKDNGLGEIVGEIPGNLPDSYTANVKYQLPNSRLRLALSTSRQNRIDETKIGQPLYPDYQVEASQALDQVYELVK